MVEFSGVSKSYNGEYEALKNVDLTINDGEFVFVVGASGAGKSTFLKLIMREEVPTSGTVTINGYNLNKMKKRDIPYFRRTMGIVFQDFRLIPDMKVYDNVAFALRVTGTKEREVRKRVTHALGMVGLLNKTQSLPKELSGGEQQRVAIARALVNNADLIIADEPTGNIDPAMSVEIMDLLNHINKANGTTIVMVTHAHDLVRQYDHRIVVLKEGELIADGYDRDKILGLINPDVVPTDAGFYNAPNEFDDVEKFIFTYGQEDVPIEETIPQAPEAPETEVTEPEILDGPSLMEGFEEPPLVIEPQPQEEPAKSYSITDDEEISSILAAFAASSAARTKKTDEAAEEEEAPAETAEAEPVQAENTSDTASEDNGGAV
ncbi:MAG: cell division ATP-binding protein FtsE [Clostridia bacterium]|nr:cell division ATP-binding protein FtsE [Clostridia bacterium]